MRTAIDTNIISALWSREPASSHVLPLLGRAHRDGGLVICAAVYAELIAHPKATQEFVDEFLSQTNLVVDYDLGQEIWRDASRRFAAYAQRRRDSGGGQPRRLLVDFLVGSHAQIRADRLLTLDAARYQVGYPELRLMA